MAKAKKITMQKALDYVNRLEQRLEEKTIGDEDIKLDKPEDYDMIVYIGEQLFRLQQLEE